MATENAANFELTAAFSASATAYSKQIERLRLRVVEMTDKEGKSYVNAVIEGLDQICASRSPVVITKQLKETCDAISVLKGCMPSQVLESTHQSYMNRGHSNEKATIDAVADLTAQVEPFHATLLERGLLDAGPRRLERAKTIHALVRLPYTDRH